MTYLEKELDFLYAELQEKERAFMTPDLQSVFTALYRLIGIVKKIANKEGEVE